MHARLSNIYRTYWYRIFIIVLHVCRKFSSPLSYNLFTQKVSLSLWILSWLYLAVLRVVSLFSQFWCFHLRPSTNTWYRNVVFLLYRCCSISHTLLFVMFPVTCDLTNFCSWPLDDLDLWLKNIWTAAEVLESTNVHTFCSIAFSIVLGSMKQRKKTFTKIFCFCIIIQGMSVCFLSESLQIKPPLVLAKIGLSSDLVSMAKHNHI